MSRILTVTLNPALDLTTGVARLEEGHKMRCEPPQMDPGGGGANVSRAIQKLGGASDAFICTGAPLGLTYRELFEASGLSAVWHDCGVPTRQSIAVHDRASGGQYRFVMPGEPWGEPVWQGALDALTRAMRPGDLVVLSGSQPPGVPEDFRADLFREFTRASGAVATASQLPQRCSSRSVAAFETSDLVRAPITPCTSTHSGWRHSAAARSICPKRWTSSACRRRSVSVRGSGPSGSIGQRRSVRPMPVTISTPATISSLVTSSSSRAMPPSAATSGVASWTVASVASPSDGETRFQMT